MSFPGRDEFIADNPARDTTDLHIYGTAWWDEAVTWPKYWLIYVVPTGEVVTVCVGTPGFVGHGRIDLLGAVPSVEEFEAVIDGWQDLERKELNWVRKRLGDADY